MSRATPEEIEADIAHQREQLAATVDQLHAKLDVKARVKDKVTTDAGKPRADLALAALAGVALVAGLVVWRRRR